MSAPSRHVTSSTSLSVAAWRRSSHSTGANNCVETAGVHAGPHTGSLAVRDSKDPAGAALLFSPAAWRAFLGTLH